MSRRKIKTPVKRPPPQPSRRGLSDSDSVATPVKPAPVKRPSDSVARLKALNKKRAAKRTGLKCQTCGKPLATAQRATARYCSATCRSQAWRKKRGAREYGDQRRSGRHFTLLKRRFKGEFRQWEHLLRVGD